MHPVLFHIGPLTIHTYGLFVALGMLAGIWMATRQAKQRGLAPEMIMDMGFYAIIAGILGARLFFVVLHVDFFFHNPVEIIKIWTGGLVFFGGFLFAVAVLFFFTKKYRLPLGTVGDIGAVSVPLAHAIGRIGCLCAGCCYGKYCPLPWAITFTNADTLARPIGVPLHPTQLYAVLANFSIFAILLFCSRRRILSGRLFLLYLVLYGSLRSFIELFRGDPRGTIFFDWLSTSQAIGGTVALAAAVCLLVLHINDKRREN